MEAPPPCCALSLLLKLSRRRHCDVAGLAATALLLPLLLLLLLLLPPDTPCPARRLDSRHAAIDASAAFRRASAALSFAVLPAASISPWRIAHALYKSCLAAALKLGCAAEAVVLASSDAWLPLLLALPPPHVALHVSWHCHAWLWHFPLWRFFSHHQPSLVFVHGAG